ncbi:MAG: hypothetical protein V5A27_01390 [Halapricum sp.]
MLLGRVRPPQWGDLNRPFVDILEEMEELIELTACSDGNECATTAETSKCATVR